jgi:hypothetical protein
MNFVKLVRDLGPNVIILYRFSIRKELPMCVRLYANEQSLISTYFNQLDLFLFFTARDASQIAAKPLSVVNQEFRKPGTN